jgi:PncC family amidohydrolase
MIGDIAAILKGRGAKVAVAESCTGGRLAAAFTESAGASEYFLGGVVAYDNEVKINTLGVGRETIEKHGAVSREVAVEMARGVMRLTGADFATSTTGIAGPGGGSPEKPVGTVWIAAAAAIKNADGETVDTTIVSQKFHFSGTRPEVMDQAVLSALEMLRTVITANSQAATPSPRE